MKIDSYQSFDQPLLPGFLLTPGDEIAEDAPNLPASFLFEPGGQDYVGYNSYDARLAGE
jgi:hypothetical protein